jgi:hypothetical protein
MHLAAALGVPLVAIFTGSRSDLTGPVGRGPMAVVGSMGEMPTVAAVLAGLEQVRGIMGSAPEDGPSDADPACSRSP